MAVAAAGAIGGALMRTGAKFLGSKGAKSVAGSILKSGAKSEFLSRSTDKFMKSSVDLLGSINRSIRKIESNSKFSPLLSQQMKILTKGLKLMFKPLGDALARLLRPISWGVMKIAIFLNKLFSGSVASDILDYKEQAVSQSETIIGSSDIERSKMLAYDVAEQTGVISTLGGDLLSTSKVVWNNLLLSFGSGGDKIKDALRLQEKNVEDSTINIQNLGVNAQQTALIFSQISDTLTNKFLSGSKTSSSKTSSSKTSSSKTSIADYWNSFPTVDEIKNKKQGMSYGTASVSSSIFGSGKFSGTSGSTGSWASGGEVNSSGIYGLHAGEMVISAGDSSRMKSSVSNTFNVTAVINNDMDIRTLARKLAAYQESELRRRGSYT